GRTPGAQRPSNRGRARLRTNRARGRDERAARDRLIELPEAAAADQDAEDRTNPPNDADNRPQQFLAGVEVTSTQDVDEREQVGERMQQGGNHDLEQELHGGMVATASTRRLSGVSGSPLQSP